MFKVTQLVKNPAKMSSQVYVILELTNFSSDHRIYMGDETEAIIYVISHGSSS